MSTQGVVAKHALLPDGWANNVYVAWDQSGVIQQVERNVSLPPTGAVQVNGPVLPGMHNLHSHAFQRAFTGLTEYRGQAQDSFWSWRSLMYDFAAKLTPEQLQAIAEWVYVEMLEAGYTSVCEFHYVHHDPAGQPYARKGELLQRVLQAAVESGIGMTLLPVLYQQSGFGGRPPLAEQRRFICDTEHMLRLLEQLKPVCQQQGMMLGIAPHSLRAVTPEALQTIVQGISALNAKAPIHIHIAEQQAEVEACLQWSGARPVQWLLEHMPVDKRWCLVHATHMDSHETVAAARSGAVAGLCLTTEANLGDGLFNMQEWLQAGGVWGVGSDSQVSVNAAEELMLLEYGQRLHYQQRNVLATAQQPSVATALLLQAVQGGAQASGRPVAGIMVGQQADMVELQPSHTLLQGLTSEQMLSTHVFASQRQRCINRVWVAGSLKVIDGKHHRHEQAAAAFVQARAELLAIG